MDNNIQEIVGLLRYGGFDIQPQAVIAALDEDFCELVRDIDKMVTESGGDLSTKQIKQLTEKFRDRSKAKAQAEEQKAKKKEKKPALEKA